MPSLMLEIGANIARLQTDMGKAQRAVDGFAKSAKTAFAAIGAYMVGGQMISALKDVSQAYMEQERAINKMSSALKNQGAYSKEALDDMEAFATEIQNTTTVADESALAMMANLKTYGMLNDQVKEAAKVAIDFASAKREEGMTIEQASELIGKAYMGQTERLKRYGIMIDTSKSKAEQFKDVMDQLRERFGGSAAAELDTYEGQLKKINNQFGEVKEGIGKVVLAFATGFKPQIEGVITLLQEATEGLQMFFDTSERGRIAQRKLQITDQLREAEQGILDVDQAASPGLFARLYDGFFGSGKGAKYSAEEIANMKKELRDLMFQEEALNQKDRKVTGTKPPPIFEDNEKLKKSLEEQRKILVQSQQAVEEMSWEDYASGVRDVSEAVREFNRQLIGNQQNAETFFGTIDKTKELIKDYGWEDYATGAEGASEATRQINTMMVESTKGVSKEMEQWTKLAEYTAEQMQDNFSDYFFNVMRGEFESFGDFVDNTFAMIQRAAANYISQMVTDWMFGMQQMQGGSRSGGFFGELLGGLFGGGSTGAGAAAMGAESFGAEAIASMMWLHGGGRVGYDAVPMRSYPMSILAGAPRLHGGLSSDEYPAILQKGEEVIPKDGKGEQAQNINIMINAIDSKSFAELAARNPQAITGPVMEALQKGGQLRNMIKGVI